MELEKGPGLPLSVMVHHTKTSLVCSIFCFFCKSCKVPCGEMKKHISEKHGGKTDDIQMEFDHVLPLCGPGHVEKNVLSAAISVL